MEHYLDDMSRDIVRKYASLTASGLDASPVEVAHWLGLAVGDVEKRMRALAGLQQLPGYSDE